MFRSVVQTAGTRLVADWTSYCWPTTADHWSRSAPSGCRIGGESWTGPVATGGEFVVAASRTLKNRNGVGLLKQTDIFVTLAVFVAMFIQVAGAMSTLPCT